jgi:predicted Zn-dependent peptidase
MSILAGMNREVASPETLEGIKTSVKTDDIYYAEKLHYYAFIIASQMLVGGWDFVQTYAERLDAVTWADCQAVASTWLSNPSYVVTTVRPPIDSTETLFQPTAMTTEEVTTYFATATFPGHDLTVGYPLTFPATDSVSLEIVDKAEYHRQVLANGLTVIIKSSPDSRVFAMNVLGKNRTLNEPANLTGITDFVNHVIEKGTLTRDAAELSRDLSQIGANVTLYDNPWIPYDDRYTTRRFSFMKFETIEQYAPKGFFLFADMILNPVFDSTEIENVRRSLMSSLGRNSTSARNIARQTYFDLLFEASQRSQSYSRPMAGEARTIGAITRDDLREHYRRFYDPSNMIIAIGTSRSVEEIMGWVELAFGRIAAIDDPYVPQLHMPMQPTESRIQHTDVESEQITIYIGAPLPGANAVDAVAIQVATTVLSNRLYRNLREIQGLAYSVGAGAGFDRDFGYFYSVIGTGWENYQTAVDGIMLEIDKLKFDGPNYDELDGARNSIWGRLSSARLSRINQAYYLAVDEYLGRDLGYDQIFLEQLQAVTPSDIRRVVARYFPTSGYILTSAGKKE